MKVNTYKNDFCQIIDNFKHNRLWILLFGLISFLLALTALMNYLGIFVPVIETFAIRFSVSFIAFVLLSYIGLYLIFTGYRFVWGLSFIINSILFLGLSLNALNFPLTDIKDLIIFQLWVLLPTIVFILGISIGINNLVSESKKVVFLPSIIMLSLGEVWSLFSFIILKNLELAIFGLSFGFIVPLLLYFAYTWYHLGKNSEFISPLIVSLGFFMMAITQIFWNPWLIDTLGAIYYIFFTLYNISLGIILVGFISLKKDLIKV